MECGVGKSGYMAGVPATGLRGRLLLRYSAWVEKKAAEQASGDVCTACGHDALYHQALDPRQQRKPGVPRGTCHKCEYGADIGLRVPPELVCAAFDDER